MRAARRARSSPSAPPSCAPLETAWPAAVHCVPPSGFTRLVLSDRRPRRIFDGLITGFHDPATTHADC